ncbi:MAG TPA: DNA-directed RNA polymerase subunit beta [Deltaproteobacteria bacterium]|nr:MAG: DNA-directed RNA polymerase subunit beta [Deltaproteobacteria bacterium GWA2_45_12]HBF13486.1 DNA-directed RNA polymerase subunit beta [Deltaproteobacteria bacterium]
MPQLTASNFRLRKEFSRIKKVVDIPNLIELQRNSYIKFLQFDALPDQRKDEGLQTIFKSVFPITDFNNTASLEFVSYSFEKPKYEMMECRQRGMTYEVPVKVIVRLVVWDNDPETGAQSIRDVKEQEVYFGTIPLMTRNGTFIINGTERVIVSQLHRSPGIFFEHDKGKTHASGKLLYSARAIPYRGSWLDFEFDTKDLLYVRIDRRRKLPVTILLRSLGLSEEEILNTFYLSETIRLDGKKIIKSVNPEVLKFQRAVRDIEHPKSGEVIVKKGRKFTQNLLDKMAQAKINELAIDEEEIIDRVVAHDVVDKNTGEVVLATNDVLTKEKIEELYTRKIKEVSLLFIDNLNVGSYIRNTLLIDKVKNSEEAVIEIYKRLRPGDPSTLEAATALFENLFFNPERYDLSRVGRLKINYKFGFDVPLEVTTLRKEDILEIVRYLLNLKDGRGMVDDIDHLGNRRIRAVGELLENQYRIGLVRMERAIKERMSLQEIETLMPNDLINAKPVSAVVKEFFGSSQLSQFMDQTNPLSEITHKRRLSALGPGGLTRERAGFEVRDVHATHYGRICPIETPEGPNIGLIASLSTYARVNEYGFIETPYRKVEGGRVTDEVAYYSALDEANHVIGQANAKLDAKGHFIDQLVSCRKNGEFMMVNKDEVDLMDVSPNQLVSIAASLIPFLEHDDANRALMGSNMQRQAVPLLRSRSPIVGTGIEPIVARDSGITVVTDRDGIVISVDASRIVVKADKAKKKDGTQTEVDIYNMLKYQRSNQNTCINQIPLVSVGDHIKKGEIIADGCSTERGELALGQNVTVAFMPWGGFNFEDSVLISERLVKEDTFTSIHIEEFECIARDTKLGREEITRDIPNVGEEALKNLDESGIVRIGAEVKPDDILVGKITPKGETQLSPEEKLLRAIFGEKAGDVKDSSLRVGPGIVGTVIATQVFSREGIDLDERSREQQDEATKKLQKDQGDELGVVRISAEKKLAQLLVGQTSSSKVMDDDGERVLLVKGKKITESMLKQIPFEKWKEISVEGGDGLEDQIGDILEEMEDQMDLVRMVYDQKVNRLKKGDELPPGVIKIVKVYVAIKRKMMVGDKVAGRHGNKGVISRILPEEDMPYMEDGTPVDVVLNPLGVPSRMNIGQILEVHLGRAGRALGHKIRTFLTDHFNKDDFAAFVKKIYQSPSVNEFIESATQDELLALAKDLGHGVYFNTPVFDGAREEEIKYLLGLAGVPESGQVTLFDGRTGDAFEHPVTVGDMYILKLHHLVDDKIHARSIGPYSLVTQQPLGGKAQFGGQRMGEMEVWAMEAYGASYALQEFLTVKSDDVIGRTRMYEHIVKGDHTLEPGLPESFKVLIKEMQSLALNVELIEEK